MLRRTPLKVKKLNSLKKTPLKGYSSLKKTCILKNKGTTLKKTVLKKQNEEVKEKWEQVREECLRRDNYKCVVCGKKATQVHHIHLRSKRKDLVYVLSNLRCLCNLHHDHMGIEGLEKVNTRIALKEGISLEELYKKAENKE